MLVHSCPFVQMDQAFGSGRMVAECAVWPSGVVVTAPFFNDDLGLLQRVEDLAVEKLVA